MSREKILEKNLWGVHLPLLDSHYKFKEKILDSMQEYANQEVEKALKISELTLKKYEDEYYRSNNLVKMPRISTFKSGMLKILEHLKTNKEQTKDETRIS